MSQRSTRLPRPWPTCWLNWGGCDDGQGSRCLTTSRRMLTKKRTRADTKADTKKNLKKSQDLIHQDSTSLIGESAKSKQLEVNQSKPKWLKRLRQLMELSQILC